MIFIIIKVIILGVVVIVFIGRAISSNAKEKRITNNPEESAKKLRKAKAEKFINIDSTVSEIYKRLQKVKQSDDELGGYFINKLVLTSDNELIATMSKTEKIKPLDSHSAFEGVSNLNKVYLSILLYKNNRELITHSGDLISENEVFGGTNSYSKVTNAIATIARELEKTTMVVKNIIKEENNIDTNNSSEKNENITIRNNVDIKSSPVSENLENTSLEADWEEKFNNLPYDKYLQLKNIVTRDLPQNLDKSTIKELIIEHLKNE